MIENQVIYIWHHPNDLAIAQKIKVDLKSCGLDVFLDTEKEIDGSFSFGSVDWRLAKFDCVIFLLSKDSVHLSSLTTDARKVLREPSTSLLLASIDSQSIKNVPIIIKFLPFIKFQSNYHQALSDLIDAILLTTTKEDNINKGFKWFIKKPFDWLIEHYRRYLLLPPLTFCWQITIENLIVSLSVSGIIIFFFQPIERTNLNTLNAGNFLWMVIILGPIIETIALQMIPVFIGQVIGLRFFGQITLSIIPFTLLHFTRSTGAGIGAGLIGGFYSAFTYVHWREKSLWTAFWVTALSHGLYNLAIFTMIIGDY